MNIRKCILVIALIIICSLILSACGSSTTEAVELDPGPEIHGLVQIGEEQQFKPQLYQCVMYDPETKVMYTLIYYNSRGGITLSPLYNADGTLRLYNPNE